MNGKVKDLVGQVFGRLTITSFDSINKHGGSVWNTLCSCGNTKKVSANHLRQKNTLSCGCANYEARVATCKERSKHGQSGSPTYETWCRVIQRTTNKNNPDYKYYGGRGIKVCDRWKSSFENFLEDMGEKPEGLTIEREDVNGNYEPSNCRWDTWEVQHKNIRTIEKFNVFGDVLTLTEMSKKYAINRYTLKSRIKIVGMTPEEALTLPISDKICVKFIRT